MAIEISVVKSPDHVQLSKVCQIFSERGGTIGRGETNTWIIEDPERFISSTHTQIVFENGQYYLTDVSTNGTFLNGSAEPIGNGNRVLLSDGDNFSLGDYEFQISITPASEGAYAAGNDPFASAEFAEHSADNMFATANSSATFPDYADPFSNAGIDASPIADILPVDDAEETDPLAMLDKAGRGQSPNPFMDAALAGSRADNADPMQQAVAWPNVIPDDWDEEISESSPEVKNTKAIPEIPAAVTAPAPPNRDILEKLKVSEHRREALEIENEQLLSEVMRLKQKLKNIERKSSPARASSTATQIDEILLGTMGLRQWELSEDKKAEISATVGCLMRESIAGLMQTLSFRKKIKEEFRINVTTIQPVENNPLKFSANVEDALENMFIKDNKAYMNPADAVREGFQGISEHQIAVLAGIQAAFRGMIERLDPEALEKRFEKYRKTGVIKVGQKGKNWESYKEFHQDLVNNIDNSFQYLFGYDFVQAYEEQLQRLLMARKAKARN